MFLYAGWRILSGELPYRDIWDHKPPVVFYINAVGLSLAERSRWGVWALEFGSLLLAASIGFYLVKKALGGIPAICSLFMWLLTLTFLLQGGNLTTEYTLPLQFLALWLVVDAEKDRFPPWRWFLIGLTGAVAFFTKQTAVGIWIAIVLYVTLVRLQQSQPRRWLREILYLSSGSLFVSIVVISFFGIQGALGEFWSAAFRYNLITVFGEASAADRLHGLLIEITPLAETGLLQFALIGYGFGVLLILFRRDLIKHWRPLLLVLLIDLPIEAALVAAPGLTRNHYYMTMLPALSVLSGLTFWVILSPLSAWGIPTMAKSAAMLGIVGIVTWSSLGSYAKAAHPIASVRYDSVTEYIRSNSSPDASVLLWGAETAINFQAERRSPTRFVYQYPLFAERYVDEQMILEFLGDLMEEHPRLIIDTRYLADRVLDFPIETEAIREKADCLRSQYRIVAGLGDWIVYEYVGGECVS